MAFGGRLKQLRKEKGLSQKELAEYLELSEKIICDWEEGILIPDAEDLSKLQVVFGVDVYPKKEVPQDSVAKPDNYLFDKNEKITISGILLLFSSMLLTGPYQALEYYLDHAIFTDRARYLKEFPLNIMLYGSVFLIILGVSRKFFERRQL